MDQDAESPEQAALQAWNAVRRPDSMANVFTVFEEGPYEPIKVDLQEVFEQEASQPIEEGKVKLGGVKPPPTNPRPGPPSG